MDAYRKIINAFNEFNFIFVGTTLATMFVGVTIPAW